MRVTFVAELFHPHLGGAEFRTLQFARGLARRGHRVTVYTIDHTGGQLPKEESLDGIRVIRWTRMSEYIGPRGRSLAAMIRYGTRAAALITDGVSEESDAVVVSQWPLLHLLRIPPAEVPPGVVVDWCEWWDTPARRPVFERAVRSFPRGIAVEDHVAARIRRANPQARVEVVRTPVPLDMYRSAACHKERDLVVFVGRVAAQKRVGLLAAAIRHLNEAEGASKRLVVVGDGELRPRLEERFSRYPYIEFLGRVSESDKADWLRRAWALGICSRREGMPVTLMEAVASGTPVVAVRAAMNPSTEFVEAHGIGEVARSPRVREVARAVAALDDEARWKRMRDAEERLLPLFHPSKALETLERFLIRTGLEAKGAAA